jgi:hypothetical protein
LAAAFLTALLIAAAFFAAGFLAATLTLLATAHLLTLSDLYGTIASGSSEFIRPLELRQGS